MAQTVAEIMAEKSGRLPGEAIAIRDQQIADEREEALKPAREAAERHAKEQQAAKLADEAKRAQERADRIAADEKATALRAWSASGGSPSDFEAAWPGLRAKLIEQRTLEKLGHPSASTLKL